MALTRETAIRRALPRALAALGRAVRFVFLKIEEPRVMRLVWLGIYVTLTTMGGIFLADPPHSFEGILGIILADVFGSCITFGALAGVLTVLQGVWWAERLGIIALWTGLAIYVVVAITLQASAIGIAIAVCLILALLIRWLQVREYQLAPGR